MDISQSNVCFFSLIGTGQVAVLFNKRLSQGNRLQLNKLFSFFFPFGKMEGLYRSSGRERDTVASKVFWSQKTAGGDSNESPPFA